MKTTTMKRMAALTAGLVMATALVPTVGMVSNTAITASAADASIPTYQFKAYQVFNDKFDAWGEGVSLTDVPEDLKEIKGTSNSTPFSDATSVAAVVKALNDNKTDTVLAENFAKYVAQNTTGDGIEASVDNDKVTFTPTKVGYYVVTGTMTKNGNSANTLGMLTQVSKVNDMVTLTKAPKVDLASVEKKVYEDDATDENWVDVADIATNADNGFVKFKLTATMPSDNEEGHGWSDYTSYYVGFTDKFGETGFTGNIKLDADLPNGFKVYDKDMNELTPTSGTAGKKDAVYKVGAGQEFHFINPNVKDDTTGVTGLEAGGKIEIPYSAEIDDGVIVGPDVGYTNEVTLTYSNNPNVTTTPEISKTPDGTTTTTKDNVKGVTYGVDIIKLLKDGSTTSPITGLTEEKPLTFTIKEGETVLKFKKSDDTYVVADDKATDTVSEITLSSGSEFKVWGLDRGTYTLSETLPDGAEYTAFTDISFEIEAELDDTKTAENPITSLDAKTSSTSVADNGGDTWTAIEGETQINGDAGTGYIKFGVINTKDTVIDLPETGGIGTRIFYSAGALLTAGGAIYLVARKRMSKK